MLQCSERIRGSFTYYLKMFWLLCHGVLAVSENYGVVIWRCPVISQHSHSTHCANCPLTWVPLSNRFLPDCRTTVSSLVTISGNGVLTSLQLALPLVYNDNTCSGMLASRYWPISLQQHGGEWVKHEVRSNNISSRRTLGSDVFSGTWRQVKEAEWASVEK